MEEVENAPNLFDSLDAGTAASDLHRRPTAHSLPVEPVNPAGGSYLQHLRKMDAVMMLAGGMAHRLNNILMGVLGYASILKRKKAPGDPEAAVIEQIENAALQAASLTDQLLAFARGGKYDPRPQNINEILSEAVSTFSLAGPPSLRFEKWLDENLPPILADKTQIHQVLINLFTNAAEAMDFSGTITLETFAGERPGAPPQKPSEAGKNPFILVSVSDTGRGIPEDIRDRIFDPFFTTKSFGRGLGLAAVHGIIQNHDGAIEVQKGERGGARIVLGFPVMDVASRQ